MKKTVILLVTFLSSVGCASSPPESRLASPIAFQSQNSGEKIWRHGGDVTSVAFSPDGKRSLTGSNDGTAVLRDVATGETLHTWKSEPYFFFGPADVFSVAFTSDGKRVAIGSLDGTAVIRDVVTGETLKTWRHSYTVRSVAFSPDGKQLLVGTGDGKAFLLDSMTSKTLHTWQHGKSTLYHVEKHVEVAFSPNGKEVLTGAQKNVVLRDVSTGRTLRTWDHESTVLAVAFSPNGRNVLSSSFDSAVVLRDVATGETLQIWQYSSAVWSVAFSPDGKQVLTGSTDGTVALRDISTGQTLQTWQYSSVVDSVAFSPDGKQVLTGSRDDIASLRTVQPYNDTMAGESAANAPRVPLGPIKAESPRSPLSLTISSSQPDANGVITLRITTNGDTASLKVNGDEEGSSADGRYNVRRFAQIGETQFEVIATDRFGNTERQKVSVFRDAVASTVKFPPLNPSNVRARPATNAVAIIIGIQDYRRVPKAEFANNDARLFYDYAVRGLGVKPENIKLLLDQEADDVGILGAMQNWLPLKARKGQTDVYVFYSGHGLPSDDGASLYLLPHGVDRQFLDRTAIKQSELVSALQAANPKSVTLFMDACYSGQIRTGETLLASARPIVIAPRASTFPSNFTVLTASAPDQLASSSPDLKHGVFSYYLMKGMEGEADQNKDGSITVQEMQSYLKDSVGRKAMALNRTQQPQVVGDQSRVLVGR
jgi:WD40 repeat protein